MAGQSGPGDLQPESAAEPGDRSPDLRSRLNAALREARARRDKRLVNVLRTTLAEIANAEAVSTEDAVSPVDSDPHFAGSVSGLRAAEVLRRELDEDEVVAIARRGVAERVEAADAFEGGGQTARADELRWEAEQLLHLVDRSHPPRQDD